MGSHGKGALVDGVTAVRHRPSVPGMAGWYSINNDEESHRSRQTRTLAKLEDCTQRALLIRATVQIQMRADQPPNTRNKRVTVGTSPRGFHLECARNNRIIGSEERRKRG